VSDKPTGVFVRLPLDEAQIGAVDAIAKEIVENNTENEWRFVRHHFAACDNLVCSMGTPVTGGDLKPIGKVAGYFSDGQPMVRILNHPYLPYETEIALYSDAQAQIAALEAEIVRLRGGLEKAHLSAILGDTDPSADLECCRKHIEEALKGGAP
jgi:hypothetical protein